MPGNQSSLVISITDKILPGKQITNHLKFNKTVNEN